MQQKTACCNLKLTANIGFILKFIHLHHLNIIMRNLYYTLFFLLLVLTAGCKKEQQEHAVTTTVATNSIKYAKGLEIYKYDGFSVVKVTNPWPDAKENFTYVMQQKGGVVPDSLKKYTVLQVPLQSIVVTSTTHVPALELLGVENTLTGFPTTDYISSINTRKRIDAGKVKDVGVNENLNTEIMIDLSPDAVVGFSISSNNKTLSLLEQSGLKVLYNGDWTEQSPLGKAEWIKFFGALYDKETKADAIFDKIVKDYNEALSLAKNTGKFPTVLAGSMFQGQWYVPQGQSWASLFLKDANADYLWKDSEGTGGLSLSFESVLDKAENAEYWIAPGQFASLKEMTDSNPHYSQFSAFKNKKVYSYGTKKGAKGGILYFEMGPTRPDLILKDMIKILHPELLKDYQLYFFDQLK
jgi:iron complex transport system substrate-binding protein